MVRRSRTKKSQRVLVVAPSKKQNKRSKKEKELTKLGYALRSLGGLGGGFIGNVMGDAEGGRGIGRSIGASISKWLGSGDYVVNNNTLLSPSGSVPSMHNSNQSVVIRHKEFLMTISGKTAFTVLDSKFLNPGLSSTFKWLGPIAANFQEYRIKGLIFHYVPTSGSAVSSTSAALGTVMFQTSYRASDDIPATKLEMMNEYWATENVPNEAFCHPVECDPNENPFNVQYVRTQSLPSTENQLMYDLGVTHIAVGGQQSDGYNLGDVWVTYEVELKKPLIRSSVTSRFLVWSAIYTGSPSTTDLFNGTITKSPFNTSDQFSGSGRTLTFPKGLTGTYLVQMWIGGGATAFTAGAPTFTNCTAAGFPSASTLNSNYTAGAGSNACIQSSLVISDPGVAATYATGVPTIGGSVSVTIWSVIQVSA